MLKVLLLLVYVVIVDVALLYMNTTVQVKGWGKRPFQA